MRPELADRVRAFVIVFAAETFFAVALFWMASRSMLDMRRWAGGAPTVAAA